MPSTDSAARLVRLASEYWETSLEIAPLTATQLGEPGHDDQLPPLDPTVRRSHAQRLAAQRGAVEAIDAGDLPEADVVTRLALLEAIDAQRILLDADLPSFTVDPMSGPQIEFLNVPEYQAADTPERARDMAERWRRMGPWIDTLADRQRASIDEGRRPVRILVERVIDELRALLARPDQDWPLLHPAQSVEARAGDAGASRFAAALETAVREGVRPAFERYLAFLTEAALPAARGDDAVGLNHVPGGAELYRSMARVHTTTELDPEELH
ncbi:MAG TPA: DUF885 family protein, partial [Candidatus Limnocylindria bacterium]|nr:DUF885 family protein [Candidatus Limnocylindria bacterium]